MRYRYLSDCHMHTTHSRDGHDAAAMLCERGGRLGLYAVTITDHCECNAYESEGYGLSIRASYEDARRAGAVLGERLRVYAGVELGQPMQNLAAAHDALAACDFDLTLASVHNVKGQEDFYSFDYAHGDYAAAVDAYFDELLEMIAWGNFDSLAHVTYPWRYIVGENGLVLDDDRYAKRLDEVFLALIAGNKALELNTSGLRQPYGVTMPTLALLRRYRALGGRLVTLGSDAHRWADVGAGTEEGFALLQRAGFTHFALYSHHTPKLLPIA